MVLGLIATTLLFPFFGVISIQIPRIEKRMPMLAVMQFGADVLLVVFFQLCGMLWIAATFRSELEPSTIRMLDDLSRLTFVMVFPGYVLQLSCIALASFMDRVERRRRRARGVFQTRPVRLERSCRLLHSDRGVQHLDRRDDLLHARRYQPAVRRRDDGPQTGDSSAGSASGALRAHIGTSG